MSRYSTCCSQYPPLYYALQHVSKALSIIFPHTVAMGVNDATSRPAAWVRRLDGSLPSWRFWVRDRRMGIYVEVLSSECYGPRTDYEADGYKDDRDPAGNWRLQSQSCRLLSFSRFLSCFSFSVVGGYPDVERPS
jgi:hypothetical protein